MLRQIGVALTLVSSIICFSVRAAPPAAPSISFCLHEAWDVERSRTWTGAASGPLFEKQVS